MPSIASPLRDILCCESSNVGWPAFSTSMNIFRTVILRLYHPHTPHDGRTVEKRENSKTELAARFPKSRKLEKSKQSKSRKWIRKAEKAEK